MSGFKDMVHADVSNVFLNLTEFAELYDVKYDGTEYKNVPLVMSGLKEQDRRQLVSDHVQGLYMVTTVVHFAADSLGGVVPEKGTKIKISEGRHFRTFFVASSVNEMGMIRLELEALDE